MTPADAAKLLDLPANATPEQCEARFLELRRKLEDKIAKAPTPGLQAKYRESLAEITTAFETLTLAADSSALPVLRKNEPSPTSGQPSGAGGGPASPPAPSLPPASPRGRKAGGGREFAIVAAIAILALVGGGWYVIKTRAEHAEKERIAAEQKAEVDRKTEEVRVAAEAKKKAEEEEKLRVAAAAKAEQERLEKLAAQVRVGFSESKLLWQQAELAEREAQRELDDLKNTARSQRDVPAGQRRELELRLEAQADYLRWLTDYLARHPARRAAVRTEEFLNARQTDAAAEALAQYQQACAGLTDEITARKPNPNDLYGSLAITSTPAGISWEVNDSFGRSSTGTTPGSIARAAVGQATVTFRRPGWEAYAVTAQIAARKEARAEFTYRPAALNVTSQPAGAEVLLQGKVVGLTPLTLSDLPIREQVIEVRLASHKSRTEKVSLKPGETTEVKLDLPRLSDREFIADFTTRWAGTWVGTLRGINFSWRFEAGSTVSLASDLTGKNAGRAPSVINLDVVSRQPVVVSRYVDLSGDKYVIGHLAEENGTLVYYSMLEGGGRTARVELQRTSN